MSIVRRSGMTRAVDRADEALGALGLAAPGRPGGSLPTLPPDITSLDDVSLMDLFSRYTAWYGYATTELAKACVAEKAAEEEAGLENAKGMVREWEGTSDAKVTIARARRDTDPAVVTRREALLECYALRKPLEALVKALGDQQAFVSREVTRRTSNSADTRASRWST